MAFALAAVLVIACLLDVTAGAALLAMGVASTDASLSSRPHAKMPALPKSPAVANPINNFFMARPLWKAMAMKSLPGGGTCQVSLTDSEPLRMTAVRDRGERGAFVTIARALRWTSRRPMIDGE